MPSTYSTHLLLELMADGENEGLWGDITNTNLEILGRAISGSTNVTLAGTSHTLTVSQAALSEGHYSVLVLGGAPTGTNTITINPNTVPRIYLVKNDSGQDAVFTQGSGGDATVVNGDIGILFSDGGGASASVTDLTPGLMRNSENLSGLADAATALQNLGVTATAGELNALDGATLDISAVTATAAEVNTLDGFTGNTDDLNYAKDLRATGVTTTEFDKLDGLTASTAELNTLDGVTATTAELNKLDGVTVSTAEINHLDGVTSGIQGQLDGKITSVTAGNDLTGGGSSGSVTINHANTSNQGSVNNGGNTVIQDIFLDSNGHVTNINSKTVTIPEQGGMTLVDTIAVSGGFASTSITFSDYEMILCIVDQVSFNVNGTLLEVRLAGTNYRLSPDSDNNAGSLSGMIEINVPTGVLKSHLKDSDSGGPDLTIFVAGNLSGETSIGFDPSFGRSFDAGQILVYGVK